MAANDSEFEPKTQVIVREDVAVRQELDALCLTPEIINRIADAAATAKADTMAVEPMNAPGINAYNKGVAATRMSLIPLGCRMSHERGIEATVNDKIGVQFVFQNVDVACTDRDPQAISGKGSGSRKLVYDGQRQHVLFERVEGASEQIRGVAPEVWLICVSTSGKKLRAEVSCPLLFEGNQFEGFAKRIFVVDRDYDPTPKTLSHEDEDIVGIDDFEVKIVKK